MAVQTAEQGVVGHDLIAGSAAEQANFFSPLARLPAGTAPAILWVLKTLVDSRILRSLLLHSLVADFNDLLTLGHGKLGDVGAVVQQLHPFRQPVVGFAPFQSLFPPQGGEGVVSLPALISQGGVGQRPKGLFGTVVDAHIGPAVGAVVDIPIAFAVVDDGGIGEDYLAAAVVADGWDLHRLILHISGKYFVVFENRFDFLLGRCLRNIFDHRVGNVFLDEFWNLIRAQIDYELMQFLIRPAS